MVHLTKHVINIKPKSITMVKHNLKMLQLANQKVLQCQFNINMLQLSKLKSITMCKPNLQILKLANLESITMVNLT